MSENNYSDNTNYQSWPPPTSPPVYSSTPVQPQGFQPPSTPITSSPTPDKSSRYAAVLLSSVLLASLAGGISGFTVASLYGSENPTSSASSTVVPGTGTGSEAISNDKTVSDVAASTLPLVVSVATDSGQGTGFFVNSGEYVVTNNHVVQGQSEVSIVTAAGDSVKAKVVGVSSDYDLAVLKPVKSVSSKGLVWGDSNDLVIGDFVLAAGSPLGLEGTVTSGIVSSLDRPVVTGGAEGAGDTSIIEAIQTDASINPGNSGGPLVNFKGEVVGVNTAIATLNGSSGQAGSIGLGFSIPSDKAKSVVDALIEKGSYETPYMGVLLSESFTGDGVQLEEVTPGSPAALAGLKAGDVIVDVDGKAIKTREDLVVAIRGYDVGETVIIKDENGTEHEVVLSSDRPATNS